MELAKIPATLFNRCSMIYGVFKSSDASGSPLSRSMIEAPPGHRHKKRKMVASCSHALPGVKRSQTALRGRLGLMTHLQEARDQCCCTGSSTGL